jgi:hypothetical protein
MLANFMLFFPGLLSSNRMIGITVHLPVNPEAFERFDCHLLGILVQNVGIGGGANIFYNLEAD